MSPTTPVGSELHQIALSVARMEGKLDGVLASSADHEARLRTLESAEHAADHEARLRKLERALWVAVGAGGALGGGVAAVVSKLTGG